MTNDERRFAKQLLDVQARHEVQLQEERARSDRYAATIAERDQQAARLHERAARLRSLLTAREEQLDASARRCTKLAKELASSRALRKKAATTDTELAARFWERTTITPDGCWEWTGAWSTKDATGRIQVDGQSLRAPRVAFRVAGRRCPAKLRRGCDTLACVNPDHWISNGTARSNLDGRSAGRAEGGNGSNASS